MLKTFTIIALVIYLSIILTTSGPFQNNNLFQDNSSYPSSSNIKFVNAEKDEGGDDKKEDDKDASVNNADNSQGEKIDKRSSDSSNSATNTDEGTRDNSLSLSSVTDNPPPDNSPPVGNPYESTNSQDFKNKVKSEFKEVTKKINKNKIVVRDYDNKDKEIIIVSNKNTCPTQSGTVGLTEKISPKGIRLLADFDPCLIKDGSVTFNIPNTPNIKLAVIYIDKKNNNHEGTLINPVKIQNVQKNQGLFTIDLDKKMTGLNPVTGKSNTLTKINGLALFNIGENPIQFKSGNTVALTSIFTK